MSRRYVPQRFYTARPRKKTKEDEEYEEIIRRLRVIDNRKKLENNELFDKE